jgi:hypothetical protein
LEEYGFELVVGMVGQEEHFAGVQGGGEQAVAGVAGGGLERGAGGTHVLCGEDFQGDAQAAREGAAVLGPLAGGGAEAVVDMEGAEVVGARVDAGERSQQGC